MRILIDIGHPAHVHIFKNFAKKMQEKNHLVLFTCRDKEFEIFLLRVYGFDYQNFGKKFTSRIGKLFGMIKFDLKEVLAGLRFKPDIFLSHGSIYAAHAAFLLRKPHITLEDTFNFEQIRFYKPFTDVILTSDYEHPMSSDKIIRYSGYHELAYLHPNNFYPNKNILDVLNLDENDEYVIIRFVSWDASHDIGHTGISLENKISAVKAFSNYARVFISSEGELPGELEKYRFKLSPHLMHQAMAFASLVYGESATMASEAAMLGVPSIFLDNTGRFYTKEQEEKYGLVFNYSESEEDQIRSIKKGLEILQMPNKKKWQQQKNLMLEDKIDVTTFFIWFVENYPQSFQIMKENPDYQIRFK